MEILRGNFEEELRGILKAIDEADFISFDYEFTGLFTEKEVGITDTHAERYDRHRQQCVRFLLLQAGICTFKFDASEKCYRYRPYSFYLFPHSSEQMRTSPKVFLLDAASIDFLANHNFDFNKAFYEGIGFGTLNDFEAKKVEIEKRFKGYIDDLKSVAKPSMTMPDAMMEFVDEKVEEVKQFLAKNPGKDEELVFSELNGYERKLLFTFLPLRVSDDPHKFTIESKHSATDGPTMVIRPNLEGVDGKIKAILRRQQQQIENLENTLGFSKVVQALSRSKAILIGHNQGIDLMHTLHHCLSPLPQSYSDYKDFVTTTFPKLIDTKYLASVKFQDSAPNTTLGVLYKTVKALPFRKIDVYPVSEEFDMTSDETKFHDAAFDAFITGFSLLAMFDSIAHEKNVEVSVANAEKLLKKYFHRIPMMGAIGATHMNLGGSDESINRENLYMINFPAAWRVSDIQNIMKTADVEPENFRIHWINDTSACLHMSGSDIPHDRISNLSKADGTFRILTFTNYMAQKHGSQDISSEKSPKGDEPSAKRIKVANGSTKEKNGDDNKRSSGAFEVPSDW